MKETTEPATDWVRQKGKAACHRDPGAGPGNCWHWWEGCPNAQARGCCQLWSEKGFAATRQTVSRLALMKHVTAQP